MKLIPNIGLAKFKLHPTKNAQENPITCVLAHNVEAFYTVTPERMKELISIEDKHKVSDIDTAYACAVDALEMVDSSKNPDLFYEIEQIIIACIGDDEFNKIKSENKISKSLISEEMQHSIKDVMIKRREFRNDMTRTYIVRKKGTSELKIGKSTNVDFRLNDIANMSGSELEIVAVFSKNIENAMHRKFAHLRTIGEWFDDSTMEIQEFISKGEQWVIEKFVSEGIV